MGWVPLYTSVDYFDNYWYFFVLLVVVWHLNLWLGFYRLRVEKVYFLPLISFVIFQVIAALFALNNVTEVDQINENLSSQILSVKYQIDPPRAKGLRNNQLPFRNFDFYIGRRKEHRSYQSNILLKEHGSTNLTASEKQDIRNYFEEELSKWPLGGAIEYYVTIHADKSIPFSLIKEISKLVADAGFTHIFYLTLPQGKEIPLKDYPIYFHYGILDSIHHECSSVIEMIDSLKSEGLKASELEFPEHPCYRAMDFKNKNRIKVSVNCNEEIMINGQQFSINELAFFADKFIKKYPQSGIILCVFDDKATYESYIRVRATLINALLKVRRKAAMALYGIDYLSLDKDSDELQIIDLLFPNNIIELTGVDKYLYEYAKQ